MINTKDFLKSDKASEFDVSFTDKEWVAIKTWMKEYAKQQLLLHNVSVSLPLEKLYQWCKEEGYKVDAELLVRSNSNVIKPIIVDCNSISSVEEFLEHISNER